MNFEIEKRTLADGWVEVRLVTLRPKVTPDFKYSGSEARQRIAELFLSGAAGICDAMGYPQLSMHLGELWSMARQCFDVADLTNDEAQKIQDLIK
jgi:hypothetical protein